MIRSLLISMRPAQWLKNVFVLVAPLFALKLHEPTVALQTAAAFWLFSMAASGVYLLNDVADRDRDREHPDKRRRPIAAGELAVGPAVGTAAFLIAVATVLAFRLDFGFGVTVSVYVAIQMAYSWRLRQVVLLDVFCIASGFVLRVLAGAQAPGIAVSSWLLLTTIFLSLFLALCKRRAEISALAGSGTDHRHTLGEYDPRFLDQIVGVTAASVVLCYSLYTLDSRTESEFGTRNLVMTVPMVLYGVFRYLYLVHMKSGGGSPATTVLRDRSLLVNSMLWLAVTAVVIYMGPRLALV